MYVCDVLYVLESAFGFSFALIGIGGGGLLVLVIVVATVCRWVFGFGIAPIFIIPS